MFSESDLASAGSRQLCAIEGRGQLAWDGLALTRGRKENDPVMETMDRAEEDSCLCVIITAHILHGFIVKP